MSFFTCANNSTNPVHSAAILAAQEEEEDTQLLSTIADFEVNGHSSIDDDETTLWLKYTKWPVTLAGRPLVILSASALRPANYGGDNILGSWSGFDFDSPEADESKLLGIMMAADAMFERALETLDHTPHRTRCWLATYDARRFMPLPFTRLQTAENCYIVIWKQFLCYIFRA